MESILYRTDGSQELALVDTAEETPRSTEFRVGTEPVPASTREGLGVVAASVKEKLGQDFDVSVVGSDSEVAKIEIVPPIDPTRLLEVAETLVRSTLDNGISDRVYALDESRELVDRSGIGGNRVLASHETLEDEVFEQEEVAEPVAA